MKELRKRSKYNLEVTQGCSARAITTEGTTFLGEVVAILPWGPPDICKDFASWINNEPECVVIRDRVSGKATHFRPSKVEVLTEAETE